MKIILILIGINVIISNIYAQSDLRAGFIVTHSNDTIQGMLDYNVPKINSRFCVLKQGSEDDFKKFYPNEIRAYGYENGKMYISKSYSIDDSLQLFFMEYLVDGVLNLYYLSYKKLDYFLIEKDQTIYKLSNDYIIYKTNEGQYRRESNKYKGVLLWLMSDVPSLAGTINKLSFDHPSLTQLVLDYHKATCSGGEVCVVYHKKEVKLNDSKWNVHVGVAVEYLFTQLNSQTAVVNNHIVAGYSSFRIMEDQLNFETNKRLMMPSLELIINRNNKTSFHLGVLVFQANYPEMEVVFLQFPLKWHYDLLQYRKVTPFFEIGLSLNAYLKTKIAPLYLEFETAEFTPGVDEPEYVNPTKYYLREQNIRHKVNLGFNSAIGLKMKIRNGKAVLIGGRLNSFGLKIDGQKFNADFYSRLKYNYYAIFIGFEF